MVRLTLRNLAVIAVVFSLWTVAWLLFQEGKISTTTNSQGLLLPLDQFVQGRKRAAPSVNIEDALCRGCRHAIADPNDEESERCGVYIEQELTQPRRGISDHPNVQAAAAAVALHYPLGCRWCEPSAVCDKKYWRYDAAAPLIRASKSMETWLPGSFPGQHRLPSATKNITDYFMDTSHVFPAAEYFMEYNPSIVILTKTQVRDLQLLSDKHYYLASFRVSNQH
jgi:hypothetical protein